jgi:hypothetical protein
MPYCLTVRPTTCTRRLAHRQGGLTLITFPPGRPAPAFAPVVGHLRRPPCLAEDRRLQRLVPQFRPRPNPFDQGSPAGKAAATDHLPRRLRCTASRGARWMSFRSASQRTTRFSEPSVTVCCKSHGPYAAEPDGPRADDGCVPEIGRPRLEIPAPTSRQRRRGRSPAWREGQGRRGGSAPKEAQDLAPVGEARLLPLTYHGRL